ncbi:MAG: hypothetical protein RL642_849 [Bacteroidota bacterium]|jgi:MFS family permease
MKMHSAKYPWMVVALLWGVALLNYLDRQMLSTMKPAIMVDIPSLASATQFGHLMAVFLWIYGWVSPFAGFMADRFSKKRIIVGSLFVWSAVTFTMGYATTFDQLYVLRAMMGVSEALYIPAGLALIAEYHSDKSRSLAVGIHMTGLYMGQALGGFGATLASDYSWNNVFQVFGGLGVIYAVVLLFLLKDKKSGDYKINDESAHPNKVSLLPTLRLLAGTFPYWILLFYFAIPSIPGWAIKNWLPTLIAENLQIEMSVAGPLSTITIAASSFVGVIIGGIVSDRWMRKQIRGRVYTSAIGLALTLPALLLIGLGTDIVHVVAAAICFGFGFGMFDANNMPILCQLIPAEQRATAYGFMNMVGVFAGAFITDFLGKSTDAGRLGIDFALMAAFVLIALFLQLIFLKPKSI